MLQRHALLQTSWVDTKDFPHAMMKWFQRFFERVWRLQKNIETVYVAPTWYMWYAITFQASVSTDWAALVCPRKKISSSIVSMSRNFDVVVLLALLSWATGQELPLGESSQHVKNCWRAKQNKDNKGFGSMQDWNKLNKWQPSVPKVKEALQQRFDYLVCLQAACCHPGS